MTQRQLPVAIRWGWVLGGGRRSKTARLTISDEASGVLLADIELLPEQVVDILGCTYTVVPATVASQEELGRVGKTYTHEDVPYPKDIIGYGRKPNEQMNAFAAAVKDEHGFHVVSWTSTNSGWKLTGARWV